MIARVSFLALLLSSACVPGAVESGAVPGGGCRASPDCPQGFFCVEGACQVQAGTCSSQRDCNLPDVCMAGHCLPGCAVTGCDPGEVCNRSTGLCDTATDGGAGDDGGADAGDGSGTPDGGPGDAGTGGGGSPDAGGPPPPPGLVNGTFESGLSGWDTAGQTGVSTDAHTGSKSAMVGSAAASFDSSIEQHVTLPQGAQLSFWFKSVCSDIVDYDWATVAVKDTAGNVLASALPHTCTNSNTWVQHTADLSALSGQTVVLSFENHDDGYPGDPTYTLYDDIAVGSGGSSDFSLSASPGSASGAANVNVASAALNGFSGSITLSVGGAPAGGTASLSATSISAGGGATLSLAPGTAPAGTYGLTVTGVSGSLSHSASVSWTIAGAAQPNFSLSASPGSVSGSGSSTIALTPANGFAAAVTLSASNAPSGATVTLSTTSLAGSGSATLSFNPGTAAAGTYTVTVSGVSGSLSHSASVSWTIAAAACTTDTWSSWAKSFFVSNCNYCHSQFGTYSNVKSDSSSIQSRINSGNMPQDHSLSSSDKWTR